MLILDESVAALDVSIQAQVLNLLADIRDATGVSYILISHDLAVVRQLSDEAIVMHRGQVVERGRPQQVLDDPQDPYTQLLRASVPRRGLEARRAAGAPTRPKEPHDPRLDLALVNGRLRTLDPRGRRPPRSPSADGTIVAVGDDREIRGQCAARHRGRSTCGAPPRSPG